MSEEKNNKPTRVKYVFLDKFEKMRDAVKKVTNTHEQTLRSHSVDLNEQSKDLHSVIKKQKTMQTEIKAMKFRSIVYGIVMLGILIYLLFN